VDPEAALEKANRKFIRRFNYVEEQAMEKGRELDGMTLEEMDSLWDEAKTLE
jgi:XTP/dITP diphosphohydrolase